MTSPCGNESSSDRPEAGEEGRMLLRLRHGVDQAALRAHALKKGPKPVGSASLSLASSSSIHARAAARAR